MTASQTLRRAAISVLCLHIAVAPADEAAIRGIQPLLASIQDSYAADLEAEQVVGSAMLILTGREPIAEYYYGYSDLAGGRRVDENTIFHWASVTKTFTSVAAMQLLERGLLDLDASVVSFLPELEAVHNPFGPMDAITIRHLLSHSAGFRGPTWPWGGDEAWHPHEPTEWSQLVAMMPYTEIEFEPGSRFGYSNLGTVILGQIIEKLSGDDIEVYIDKNILKPLGMTQSFFGTTPWYLRSRRTNGYYVEDGEIRSIGAEFDTGITAANGGLNGPLSDMARFVNFLAGMSDSPHADEVLQRDTLAKMFEPIHKVGSDEFRQIYAGLGFFIVDNTAPGSDETVRWVGHSGFQLAHRSFIYVRPWQGYAAVVTSNTVNRDSGNPSETALRIRLLNELFTGVAFSAVTPAQKDQ